MILLVSVSGKEILDSLPVFDINLDLESFDDMTAFIYPDDTCDSRLEQTIEPGQ